jgi:hypothetical protein
MGFNGFYKRFIRGFYENNVTTLGMG